MSAHDEVSARVLLAAVRNNEHDAVAESVLTQGAVETVQKIVGGEPPFADASKLRTRLKDVSAAELLDATEAVGARVVVPGDDGWPTQLDDLGPAMPYALWVRGAVNLRMAALRSVALVGARAATSYGEQSAIAIAETLSLEGWSVFSGGAYGIDAAAHRGALAGGGSTVCVLAGGVDVLYPKAHDALFARIATQGALVSEVPPGGESLRFRFLMRNRIIAALTRGTVVVEAALRSGSLSTARNAIDLNRPLMAVPGPVTSPMSAGCHELIRSGEAMLVTSGEEVIEMLSPMGEGLVVERRGEQTAHDRLSALAQRVFDYIPLNGGIGAGHLAMLCDAGDDQIATALRHLVDGAFIERGAQGWVKATPRQ